MPRRHRFQHVTFDPKSRPSALKLDKALIAAGYTGSVVNLGRGGLDPIAPRDGVLINKPGMVTWASNKRAALNGMRAAGVPCPREWREGSTNWPLVGRTDRHRAGQGFWIVNSGQEFQAAVAEGATHFMEYIANAREFRVHIAFGKSIKLTEKVYRNALGREREAQEYEIRNHANGFVQIAPRPNAHRVSLRKHAKDAVEALGLDFGAVDILMREEDVSEEVFQPRVEFYVLEVNTAPALTDPTSDTLARYVQAFVNHANGEQERNT